MFEKIVMFFKKVLGAEQKGDKSKNAAKERLHLVLIQDRASVSADFLEAMKQEIIEVIKKYIEVDETSIDVRLTNKTNEDGTTGAPALYANIPITNVKNKLVFDDQEPEKATGTEGKEEVIEENIQEQQENEEQKNEEVVEETKEIKEQEVIENNEVVDPVK